MMLDVGKWALRRAALDYAAWLEQGLQPPRVAVNVSQIQLRQNDFVADVKNSIQRAGRCENQIDLEITESMIMKDVVANISKLKELREADLSR